jgi:hypothetical protein
MEQAVISQISYQTRLIDVMKDQKQRGQTPSVLHQKTRFRNNLIFPLTMASPIKKSSQMFKQESLILSSNHDNPQIISI